MADCESSLDASDFYHSALDNLMSSLQIISTPGSSSSCCNNSFQRHFNSANESKFFSFCSTLKLYSKDKKCQSTNKMKQNADNDNKTPQQSATDTPKRVVTTTRKVKLFETKENAEEFKPKTLGYSDEKEVSPQSVLLKKEIIRLGCMQRREKRIALNEKPMRRTSLRV